MKNHETGGESAASPGRDPAGGSERPRLSRRQALGRMSAVATAGAAAWVVPEILTAKPASGASLSGDVGTTGTGASVGVTTGAGTTGGAGIPATEASATAGGSAGTGSGSPSSLAFTGLDIKRDAEVGAALVAGGWAMHHWASRTPKPAPKHAIAAEGGAEVGSTDTPT
jgi:hypothetical protein